MNVDFLSHILTFTSAAEALVSSWTIHSSVLCLSHTCPEYSVGLYIPLCSSSSSLQAVWDILGLDSSPKLCSTDMTGQISVTPANIFKLLPSGCRGHWAVLEMIALTVSDANHSWKGDSTFGCYLLTERKKNTYKFNFRAFWSIIHTGCGKCVWSIHISKESFWREKHAAEIISHHPAYSALMILYFLGANLLTDKLSFHKKPKEEHLCTAPVEYLRTQCKIFGVTPGCVLGRQHLTGLKWSQGRYESRHCLSKPGNNQPPPSTSGAQLKVISPKQCAVSTVSLKK